MFNLKLYFIQCFIPIYNILYLKLCKLLILLGNPNFRTEMFNYSFPLILNQLYINPSLHYIINIAFIIVVSRCQIVWKNSKSKYLLLFS